MTREEAIVLIERSVNELKEMMQTITMPQSAAEQLQKQIDAHEMAISAIRQQDVTDKDVGKNEPLKEFAEDVARQFAYHIKTIDGYTAYSTGGLSTLETAFDILGWDEPHPCPECECQADGCHEWATCGTPTKDGYKRLCGKHFKAVQEGTV